MNKQAYSRATAFREAQNARARRRTATLACIALAGVLALGGTLAFITTATNEVSNTFRPTDVSCLVDEGGFENGDEVKENVKIKNTGTTDAFIRVEIVANWAKLDDQGNNESILATAPVLGKDYELNLEDGTNWTQEMGDGYYYYQGKVAPNGFTDVLIRSCYPKSQAPVDGYILRIDVIAEAIQAIGSSGSSAPVDSWDNDKVEVTRSNDGSTISVANLDAQDN